MNQQYNAVENQQRCYNHINGNWFRTYNLRPNLTILESILVVRVFYLSKNSLMQKMIDFRKFLTLRETILKIHENWLLISDKVSEIPVRFST